TDSELVPQAEGTTTAYVERKRGRGTQTKQQTSSKTNPNSKGMEVILEQRSSQRRFGRRYERLIRLYSKILVDQVEGSRTAAKKEARKYEEEIMDAANYSIKKYRWESKQDHQLRWEATAKREKQQARGEAIRLRAGGMTQDPLDGQPYIYSQFSSSFGSKAAVEEAGTTLEGNFKDSEIGVTVDSFTKGGET
ncbi:hypothetical protein Tco_1230809, partial [Tanacetum coccineum]